MRISFDADELYPYIFVSLDQDKLNSMEVPEGQEEVTAALVTLITLAQTQRRVAMDVLKKMYDVPWEEHWQ